MSDFSKQIETLVDKASKTDKSDREEPTKAINVVFDGPPSHESGRFVEVETDDGAGIKAGEWLEREDGLWSLRIDRLPVDRIIKALDVRK